MSEFVLKLDNIWGKLFILKSVFKHCSYQSKGIDKLFFNDWVISGLIVCFKRFCIINIIFIYLLFFSYYILLPIIF